ncbi:Hypothetical predicted protein [Marmota monax]|uniref:Uncharacterized protein n=1 Tax=Marmota monax TaxID=9995 RepID=A0A5E4B778_MARMO|nr:hypothetical protein GHT09_012137 [Marmota monax]VTJ65106.1 Hypothetical predicted protein [Marmota monax]
MMRMRNASRPEKLPQAPPSALPATPRYVLGRNTPSWAPARAAAPGPQGSGPHAAAACAGRGCASGSRLRVRAHVRGSAGGEGARRPAFVFGDR